MMNQPRFEFDLNLCVGCHACILACVMENGLQPGQAWRSVHVSNPQRDASLPRFFLSLACNHCDSPACLHQCPTQAFTKNPKTGAVILDSNRCMGCRYCQWVCPYDAPDLDRQTGLMGKCTFCHERLKRGEEPACVELCPTGALHLGSTQERDLDSHVPGFPKSQLMPAVSFVPLKPGRILPRCTAWGDSERAGSVEVRPSLSKSISIKSEWSLIIFTWIAALMVGLFGARLAVGLPINALSFCALGLSAMILSASHLGRKQRAVKALRNLRRSWLSREILFFSIFLTAGTAASWNTSTSVVLRISAMVAGLACLFSIDAVYQAIPKYHHRAIHSAQATLMGIWVFGVFAEITWILITAFVLRASLYAKRKRDARIALDEASFRLTMARSLIGFFIPATFWLLDVLLPVAIIFSFIGDFLDRVEFYSEIEPVSPERQLEIDLAQVNWDQDRA